MEKVNIQGEGDFKVVYDKYFNMVYRIALIYLKNTPEAKDIVQEVFIKLLIKRSFKSKEHMKAWYVKLSEIPDEKMN